MSLQHFAAINHSVCTGRAISCCNKLRDTSQRQIASCLLVNSCLNLCLSNRILSPQQVAQIQSDLILCDLLRRHNSVAETKIFTKILQHTRSDLSPQQGVAATCRLVCSDLKTYNINQALNEEKTGIRDLCRSKLKID